MYCNKCQCEREDSQFCAVCGEELIPVVDGILERPEMPLKWYKFVIYVQLFAMAVVNLINGIYCLTGGHYQGMADTVYEMLPTMLPLDTAYGVLAIALAVFALVVRGQLANWKAAAPKLYLLLLSLNLGVSLLYNVAAVAVVVNAGLPFNYNPNYGTLISSTVTSVVMIACNAVYFKKRAHLFEY